MICTVYCILCIFYWELLVQCGWDTTSQLSVASPSRCSWQAVKMHIDLDYNERPFYRLGPRGHSHRSVAVRCHLCPGQPCGKPRGEIMRRSANGGRCFQGTFCLYTYIYTYRYIHIYIHIDIHIYIYR